MAFKYVKWFKQEHVTDRLTNDRPCYRKMYRNRRNCLCCKSDSA